MTVDRVIIAAPASGSGKTTVATGLMAALVARGCRVAPFKVGPDYIDPGYHAVATGRRGRNLDPVLVGEDRIGPLFAHGAIGADLAVIEGVMGLFDGRSNTTSARPIPPISHNFTPSDAIRSRDASAGPPPSSGDAAEPTPGTTPRTETGSMPDSTAMSSGLATSSGSPTPNGMAMSDAGDAASDFAGVPWVASGSGFGPPASGFGSTAHVARLLDAPIVLVVDARGQGRSLAALLHGFRGYDPTVRLAGVVLNQVGSARHEQVLREACAEIGLPVLGAVPRGAEVALPSRHLGLVPAVEHGESARRAVAAMGGLIARSVDLDAICRLAATAGRATWPAWDAGTEIARAIESDAAAARVLQAGPSVAEPAASPCAMPSAVPRGTARALPPAVPGAMPPPMARGVAGAMSLAVAGESSGRTADPVAGGRLGAGWPVVAVAGGVAFTFGYAEHVELLRAAGALVVTVDPLRDESLPDGTAALVLPGGFPEQHAPFLSANPKLRSNVALFARSGGIVQAECGGLLYLLDQLCGEPMCGILPGTAEMAASLTLGYRDAVAATDSVAHRTGERRTGHEFHRTHVINFGPATSPGTSSAWYWRDHYGQPVREGFVYGRVHASYLHTHPAGQPETVARLVRTAREVRR